MQKSQLNDEICIEHVDAVLDVTEKLDLPNDEALKDVKKKNEWALFRKT